MGMADLFEDLAKSEFILAYTDKDKSFEELHEKVEDAVLLDLSVNDILKEKFMQKFQVKSLPVVVYKSQPIYCSDDFIARFDQLNENFYREFLKEFTTKKKYAIVIKGTIEQPYCRFTKQLIKLLQRLNITDVNEINILEDDLMREYLKKILNWNTYPMVWVDGKFIGGLDKFVEFTEQDQL